MKAPTDLKMLNTIFRRHGKDYLSWDSNKPCRDTKNYVPVDVQAIAHSLGVDVDIVWGRLYYDLDNRYSYQKANESWVHFFSPKVGDDDNCIHFPYLVSVIASLRAQAWKTWLPVGVSAAAFLVAVLSLFWNVATHSEVGEASSSTATSSDHLPNQSLEFSPALAGPPPGGLCVRLLDW